MKCYSPCAPINMALAYHCAFIQDMISSPWHVISDTIPSLSAHAYWGGVPGYHLSPFVFQSIWVGRMTPGLG